MAISEEVIRGAVARGWCSPENSHKEMDVVLASAIATEVMRAIEAECAKETAAQPNKEEEG